MWVDWLCGWKGTSSSWFVIAPSIRVKMRSRAWGRKEERREEELVAALSKTWVLLLARFKVLGFWVLLRFYSGFIGFTLVFVYFFILKIKCQNWIVSLLTNYWDYFYCSHAFLESSTYILERNGVNRSFIGVFTFTFPNTTDFDTPLAEEICCLSWCRSSFQLCSCSIDCGEMNEWKRSLRKIFQLLQTMWPRGKLLSQERKDSENNMSLSLSKTPMVHGTSSTVLRSFIGETRLECWYLSVSLYLQFKYHNYYFIIYILITTNNTIHMMW